MTTKECDHHQNKRRKLIGRLCAGTLIFLFIVLLTILIIWAILQPKKPRFFLQDATLYALNITTVPNLLSSNFQVTIYARNPNDRIGIYYDRLVAYATYRNQQITYYTAIPSTYQGHKEVNVWSPFVTGTNIPVAPYNGAAISQDQEGEAIRILIKINGRVRWKVGAITTGRYHLHVTCPAYIPFGNSKNKGIEVGTGVKYQVSTSCKVNV